MSLLGRDDFKDAPYWDVLADATPYVLPPWEEPLTEAGMLNWLSKFDETPDGYNRRTGMSLKEFMARNEKWPLRAFVGLLLEEKIK